MIHTPEPGVIHNEDDMSFSLLYKTADGKSEVGKFETADGLRNETAGVEMSNASLLICHVVNGRSGLYSLIAALQSLYYVFDPPRTVEGMPVSDQSKRLAEKFERLKGLEPRLVHLEHRIREVAWLCQGVDYACANELWYGHTSVAFRKLVGNPGFKRVLLDLIGYQRAYSHENEETQKELKSEEAYDVAVGYLTGLMPDCHNCACPSG